MVVGGSPDDLSIALRVSGRRAESADCDSLVFARPRGLDYQAGDWVDVGPAGSDGFGLDERDDKIVLGSSAPTRKVSHQV
jgi:hypothetical protein